MRTRQIIARSIALLALAFAGAHARTADADTRTCPDLAGGGPEEVLVYLNAPDNCWVAPSGCGTEEQCYEVGISMAGGDMSVGPGGGSARTVWAYDFGTGGHDYAVVQAYDGGGQEIESCRVTDTSKDGRWNSQSEGCAGTLYESVEAYRY